MGFGRDIRHAGITVGGAHGMSNSLILLLHRNMALVVLTPITPAIEQELGQPDIAVAAAAALHVVHEPAKAHERLLHFLVAVIPVLLARPEVGHPAIPKLLRGFV